MGYGASPRSSSRSTSVSYDASERGGDGERKVTIDAKYVDAHLGKLVQGDDLSRYIL